MRLASFNPRRLGRVALVIAANLCLLATLIVITEGLLRWSALVPPMLAHGAPDAALWQYDSVLGWMTVPGVRTVRPVTGPDAGVIRLNEYGFRGRALTPSRQADAPRVLVFGDSFVFGVGIDEQHLFPAVLERLLRDRRSRGHRGEDVGPWRALKKRLVGDGIPASVCTNAWPRRAQPRRSNPGISGGTLIGTSPRTRRLRRSCTTSLSRSACWTTVKDERRQGVAAAVWPRARNRVTFNPTKPRVSPCRICSRSTRHTSRSGSV